jgi:hypothetical protein
MFQKEELTLVNHQKFEPKNAYAGFSSIPAQTPDLEKGTIAPAEKSLHGCRDALGVSVRKMILNGNKNLSLDKTRWLFCWNGNNYTTGHAPIDIQHTGHQEWCERGLAILHACEKLAGWPLTKIWRVKAPAEYQYMVHTLSSRRWMKSPYLITLYVLLMRLAEDKRIVNFKNFDELERLLHKHKSSLKRDGHHVQSTLPWWRVVLRGYPDLFRQYKLPYYWSLERIPGHHDDGYGEGIARLCDGSTKFAAAHQKLKEIKQKLEKEKK